VGFSLKESRPTVISKCDAQFSPREGPLFGGPGISCQLDLFLRGARGGGEESLFRKGKRGKISLEVRKLFTVT